ncbi:MAG: DMT family transporter [Pseudomonadota bacterium]
MGKSINAPTSPEPGAERILLGIGSVALGAVGFGFLPLFLYWGYSGGLTPETGLLWRYGGGLLLMAPAMLVLGARAWHYSGRAFCAGLAMGVGTVSLFHSYASLPVTLVILIFYTYPAFTLIFGRAFFGKPMTPRLLGAVILVLLAAALIVRPDADQGITVGLLLFAFLGPMGFAGYLTLAAEIGPATHMAARINGVNLGALAVALPVSLAVLDTVVPNAPAGWLGAVCLALVTGVMSNAFNLFGAALAGGARAAIAGSAELVTALLIGVLVFAEPFAWPYLVSAVLLLAAIGLSLPRRLVPETSA